MVPKWITQFLWGSRLGRITNSCDGRGSEMTAKNKKMNITLTGVDGASLWCLLCWCLYALFHNIALIKTNLILTLIKLQHDCCSEGTPRSVHMHPIAPKKTFSRALKAAWISVDGRGCEMRSEELDQDEWPAASPELISKFLVFNRFQTPISILTGRLLIQFFVYWNPSEKKNWLESLPKRAFPDLMICFKMNCRVPWPTLISLCVSIL